MLSAFPQLSVKLVEPARWLLVMGIAYSLATTALYFLSAPASDQAAQQPNVQSSTGKRTQSIEEILARNLFGAADTTATPQQREERAVETRLPLELHGVFVADSGDQSAAIVAQKGKPGMLYSVGDSLPGNAKLVEVHTDHIVLRRGGALERLTFPETNKGQFVANPAVQARQSAPRPATTVTQNVVDTKASPREVVASYRTLLDEDPTQALSELGISPVAEGSSSGYRVGGLADSPYLSQTGLQPGDVILSVNGRPVGDIRQDRMELDNVLAQGSARLEVQRGDRRFFVTASL